MRSLCYHYGVSPDHINEAFKYAVKAADDCIAGSAYADALIHVRKANNLITTGVEARALLDVVNRAIEDMKPRGTIRDIVRRVSSLAWNEASSTFSFASRVGNMDNSGIQRMYSKLKNAISMKLIRLEHVDEVPDSKPQDGGFFVLKWFQKNVKGENDPGKLNWQPSYTANRSMFTPLLQALGLEKKKDRSYLEELNKKRGVGVGGANVGGGV